MQKESVIENRYTVRQSDQTLTTKILGSDYNRINQRPQVLDENFLNHWIDTAPYDNNSDEIVVSTQLADDESTLAQYKSSISKNDLLSFKDAMIPVMSAVLEFAYYQERAKQWNTPLNPLNLIYRQDESGIGHISAFYREPEPRRTIDGQFLDNVVKLGVYLFIPEENDSSKEYPQLTAQDYIAKITTSNEFQQMYGDDGDELIDFIYDCFSPHNQQGQFNSVKDMLENIGALDEIQNVDDPNNHGAIAEKYADNSVNLKDYSAIPEEPIKEQTAEADKIPQKSKKQKKQEELEKKRKELEEKEKKAAEEKAKKKAAKKAAKEKRRKELEAQTNKSKQKTNSKKQNSEADKLKNDKPKKKSKLPLILTALALVGGGYYMYNNHQKQVAAKQEQQQKQQEQEQQKKNNPLDNNDYQNGVKAIGTGDYKQAAQDFNSYFNDGGSMDDMNDNQIATVFNAYLHDGDYQKILDNIGNKETATSLVNYLASQNQLSKVNDLYSSQPIIKFVKADNQKNYDEMVQLSPKLSLSKNAKLQDDLCNAFAQTGKLQQGKEWAQDQSNSSQLIQAIKAHAYQINKMPHDQIDKALS